MSEIEAISTDDVRIEKVQPLSAPGVVMNDLPISEQQANLVSSTRALSASIMQGSDDRLLAVVGPCSIHDHDLAIEYASKLKEQIDQYSDDLLIVMRVYFEKPRTTVGWKGYINDPDLDGSCEINLGLLKARELLLELNEMGVTAGTEFLDTITPQYIADLVSWGAIGARTTECQLHRQLASGLSMPVGFKNGTDGNIKIAVDAIGAAKGSHHFLSVTKHGVAAHVKTKGNEDCHIILRGHSSGTNYQKQDVQLITEQLAKAELPQQIMIDFSHGNSNKDHERQPIVCDDVCEQIALGDDHSKHIAGIMIESHLVEGNQKVAPLEQLTHGQSITDACVNWQNTEKMLEELAVAVQKRRAA